MIVHCAKSMCFVRSIHLHVSVVFITKQKSLGWSKTSKRERTFKFLESIGRKDQLNIHRLTWFGVCKYSRKQVSRTGAITHEFLGAQPKIQLHMRPVSH